MNSYSNQRHDERRPDPAQNDEIDLRDFTRNLLRYKWLFLIVPVICAAAAIFYANVYAPKVYQATAQIVLTRAGLQSNFDPKLQTTVQLPDASTLKDLAMVDEMLQQVAQTPQVAELFGGNATASSIKGKLKPEMVGSGQLRLTVSDSDAQRAAVIANTWAEHLTNRLNELYGVSQSSINQIESQIQITFESWGNAEQKLLDHLSQNKLDSLQVRLDQARSMLSVYLDRIRDLDLASSDTQNLDARLANQDQNAPLRVEDSLSLIALHQRSAGELSGLQFQITDPAAFFAGSLFSSPGAEAATPEQYLVKDARANLASLITSLEDQRQDLVDQTQGMQGQITSLATQLESDLYEKEQLSVQRDLAKAAYQALSSKAEEMRIALSQEIQTAKMAGRALTPGRPSQQNTIKTAAIAFAFGLSVVLAFALVREWWLAPQRGAQPGSTVPQGEEAAADKHNH